MRIQPFSPRVTGQSLRSVSRTGFTLLELLVVISIIVIIASMTLLTFNYARDADRVSNAAASLKSTLSVARDFAVQAGKPRGVRLFLDENNYRAVTTMVFIDPSEEWTDGVIQLQRWDALNNSTSMPGSDGITDPNPGPPPGTLDINGDGVTGDDPQNVWVVAGAGCGWWELKRRGLLFDGMMITIGDFTSPVSTRLLNGPSGVQKLILVRPYRDPGDTPKDNATAFQSGGPETYSLQLAPRIVPMDPVLLPQGIVIDLDGSKIPDAWRPVAALGAQSSGNAEYSRYVDIVYSPRGSIIGQAASAGVIHFYLCNADDSVLLKDEYVKSFAGAATPADSKLAKNGQSLPDAKVAAFNTWIRSNAFIPANEIDSNKPNSAWLAGFNEQPFLTRDRRIVSVFTQTGAVSVHPVNDVDVLPEPPSSPNGPDGIADDPYRFAETGETAQ
jgi:prepilin-type N-terminal cleavage/methylation domain-containing protein